MKTNIREKLKASVILSYLLGKTKVEDFAQNFHHVEQVLLLDRVVQIQL